MKDNWTGSTIFLSLYFIIFFSKCMNGKKIFIYIHKIEHFFSLSTWRFLCWHPWRCCCYVHVSIYLFWICKAFIFSEFDKNWRLVIVTAIRNILTTSLQFRLTIFYFRKSNVRSENCIIMSIMSNWTTLKYFRLELEIILRIHRFTERLLGELYFNPTESFTYWLI